MIRRFASLANPQKYGYSYDSMAWATDAQVNSRFRMYHTYGDGLCQHSEDWSITFEYMADYLASLATEMLQDEELVQHVSYSIDRGDHSEIIDFASGVVWKETDGQYGKARFYSVSERKLSGKQALQYDKRYEVVREWNDGTPESIYRMIVPEYADGLHRYAVAEALRNWVLRQPSKAGTYMPLPGEFLKITKSRDDAQNLRHAFNACLAIVRAYQLRTEAECYLRNMRFSTAKDEAA